MEEVKPVDATCPLSGFDDDAVQWSLPPKLRELQLASGGKSRSRRGGLAAGEGVINAERVWATVLSVTCLLRFEESWLVSADHDADETLIDRAMGWLHIQQERCPRLEPLMADLWAEAQQLVAQSWELVHAISIKYARDEQMRAKELHRASQATRAAGHMATMSLAKHETISCFTAPPTDGVLRSQRVIVYLTAIIAMLCVEVRTITL